MNYEYQIEPNNHEVTLKGIIGTCPETLHIPTYLYVNNKKLKVTRINFNDQSCNVCCKIMFIPETVRYICLFYNLHIEEVYFPKTIEQTELIYFSKCSNLKKIHLHNKLNHIGYTAFSGCSSLKEIVLENTNITFDPSAFIGCKQLEYIGNQYYIENGLLYNKEKTILYSCLGNDEAAENIIIPHSVYKMSDGFGEGTCLSNYKLVDLSLTDLKVIVFNAFNSCRKLEEVILPPNLTLIDNAAFAFCEKLERINLPKRITKIGIDCFYGCAFSKIILPNQLEEIPSGAFEDCSKLEEVFIPFNVKIISETAFSGCYSLKKVTIPKGFERYIDNLFENANRIEFTYLIQEPTYRNKQTGAFTHGRLSPCPYCGSQNIRTYISGKAECDNCGGEYRYAY